MSIRKVPFGTLESGEAADLYICLLYTSGPAMRRLRFKKRRRRRRGTVRTIRQISAPSSHTAPANAAQFVVRRAGRGVCPAAGTRRYSASAPGRGAGNRP